MSYRMEFYLQGNRMFITKSEETSAYFALAEAQGQRFVFAKATNGKVTAAQIELRIYDETKPKTDQEVKPLDIAEMTAIQDMQEAGLRTP